MNDAIGAIFGLLLISLIGVLIGLVAEHKGQLNIKEEAFERGYMVKCLGKTGYYWECEE